MDGSAPRVHYRNVCSTLVCTDEPTTELHMCSLDTRAPLPSSDLCTTGTCRTTVHKSVHRRGALVQRRPRVEYDVEWWARVARRHTAEEVPRSTREKEVTVSKGGAVGA